VGTPIGRPKWELDTPALCVEMNALEKNIQRMADIIVKQNKVGWRPHTKGQKVPAVAWLEIAAGAFGVTCAKLGEAEVMAAAGIRDILIANQVVGHEKVTRLVNLRKHADVMVAVDSIENAKEIDAAARAKGVKVRVLVECDNGLHRAGVQLRESAVEFSKRLTDMPGLQYSGVMAWEAHATTILEPEKKRAVIEESVGGLVETAKMCRDAGLPADIVSCGGTGTYWVTATIPGVTEIQAGGGIFNDVHYAEHYGLPGHEFAMTMISTVTSRPTSTRIITDSGEKTMSSKQAPARPLGVGATKRVGFSAEHARIELEEPNTQLKVGDKLEWIVGYSDFTTFLHDEMYLTRDGIVEQVWPVLGRGKLR
jgi:D-serine deaminase-like pyridoxal phosphate-dependent protein